MRSLLCLALVACSGSAATDPPPDAPPRDALAVPTGLAATPLSATSLQVTWTANPADPQLTGYTLRYATSADFTDAITLAVPGSGSAEVTIVDLAPATTYHLAVRAESATPELSSAFSSSVNATTPGIPLVGTPISPLFFGQNAWMPAFVGDDDRGGDLEQVLCGDAYQAHGDPCVPGLVRASGAKLIRYGGIAVDEHFDEDLSPVQYVDMVDHIRANGAEPLLQVPYFDGMYSAAQAADLVRYVNVTMGRHVRHWTISNEPSHYGADLEQIVATVREFSVAMKAVDPEILIAGPDLSSYDAAIMKPITDPADAAHDLTGSYLATDGSTRYYLDVIDFHTYPFQGDANQSRENVIGKPQGSFQTNLVSLKGRVATCNQVHQRTDHPLTIAVTEINVDWKHPADLSLGGQGPTSFLNGQFWADVMNVGMKHGLAFVTFWSIKEGSNLGYIKNDGTLLPTYHHFKMIAGHFRGVYLAGSSPDPLLRVFGSRDVDQIVVMILDQQRGTPALDYTVRLDLTSGTAFGVDAGLAVEWRSDAPIEPESTVMLIFDAAGRLREKQVYGLSHAEGDLPPTLTTY